MRAALVALLVTSLALAGCFGGGDDPSPDPTGGTSTSTSGTPSPSPSPQPEPSEIPLLLDFSFTGCNGLSVLYPVSPEAAASYLPDGFTPQAIGGVPTMEAILLVEAFVCKNFTTATTDIGEAVFGQASIFIEEPSERYPDRDTEADLHLYLLQVLAGEDLLADVWPVAGYDTYSGASNFTSTDAVVGATGTMTVGDYVITAAGPATSLSLGDGSFRRYTVLEDGDTLEWSGQRDLTTTHEGPGSATVPADSPFAGAGADGGNALDGQVRIIQGGDFTAEDLYRLPAGTA